MSDSPSANQVVLFKRKPMAFREYLTVDGVGNARPRMKEVMAEFQRKDFAARDPALQWVARIPKIEGGKQVFAPQPPVTRFYQQRGRGSSKTTDIAVDVLWLLAFSPEKLDCVVVAEDKEQSQLLMVQADKLVRMNLWLGNYVTVTSNKILNERTGAFIKSVARDSGSSFGLTTDLIICDEWTHWTKEEMWSSIISTFAKKEKMIVVSCNAGEGNDWKWKAREEFRVSPRWYYSAPDGPAPWYTDANIAEQQRILNPKEFQRLWMNRWQEDSKRFLEPHTIAACCDPTLVRQDFPEDGLGTYFISFDFAELHDRAVGTVAHWLGGEDLLVIDRMDVFAPECQPDGSVKIRDVSKWLHQMVATYSAGERDVFVIVDKYQLIGVLQDLKEIMDPERVVTVEFGSGNANYEMGRLLQQKIVNQRIKWYPECGEIYDETGQVYRPQGSAIKDTLETELAELTTTKRGVGKWRFDHPSWGHDDRAFTVAAILWFIARELRESDIETADAEEIL